MTELDGKLRLLLVAEVFRSAVPPSVPMACVDCLERRPHEGIDEEESGEIIDSATTDLVAAIRRLSALRLLLLSSRGGSTETAERERLIGSSS